MTTLSTLSLATEYALSADDSRPHSPFVSFRTWLALRLVDTALYRRFKTRAVPAFLGYMRCRIAAFVAPIELPSTAIIGGPYVISLIGCPRGTSADPPAHALLVVATAAVLSIPVDIPVMWWRSAIWRGRHVSTSWLQLGAANAIQVSYLVAEELLVPYAQETHNWIYRDGRLTMLAADDALTAALFCVCGWRARLLRTAASPLAVCRGCHLNRAGL